LAEAPRSSGSGVVIADYGIGNIGSLRGALRRLGVEPGVTSDARELARARLALVPGVGHFGACARALRVAGLDAVLLSRMERGQHVLGICVGMQLLFEGSDESHEPGLGVLPGRVERMDDSERLPEMQWNQLELLEPRHPLLASLPAAPWVYFVHSFAVRRSARAIAWERYGARYVAAVAEGCVAGVQFHPEKSGSHGAEVLRSALAWAGIAA
jgi:glutamine amidotransferase